MTDSQILIVDDDKNIRELFSEALTLAGFSVRTAKDGEEGIKLALGYHPELIFMDIMMPGIDGHQAVQKIRDDSWGKDAKIIFLTNFTDAKDVTTALSQKPLDYIVKINTTPKKMVETVHSILYPNGT